MWNKNPRVHACPQQRATQVNSMVQAIIVIMAIRDCRITRTACPLFSFVTVGVYVYYSQWKGVLLVNIQLTSHSTVDSFKSHWGFVDLSIYFKFYWECINWCFIFKSYWWCVDGCLHLNFHWGYVDGSLYFKFYWECVDWSFIFKSYWKIHL